jgi:hypothetical protein
MCDLDEECDPGLHCVDPVGDTGVCLPRRMKGTFECDDYGPNSYCTRVNNQNDIPGQGYCFDDTGATDFCTNGLPGAPCDEDDECAPVPGRSSSEGICVGGMCQVGAPGSRCDGNGDCIDGFCYEKGDFDLCVTGKLGSRCDDDSDCDKKSFNGKLKCVPSSKLTETVGGITIVPPGRCLLQ